MPDLPPPALRARFRQLMRDKSDNDAATASLRSQRETLARGGRQNKTQTRPLTAQLRTLQEPVLGIMKEVTSIIRALDGATGPR